MYRQRVAGTDLSKTARIATDRAAWLAHALRGTDTGAAMKAVDAASALAQALGIRATIACAYERPSARAGPGRRPKPERSRARPRRRSSRSPRGKISTSSWLGTSE
jgi:hypothetical protein